MRTHADGQQKLRQVLAGWRALLPVWNDEADRFRRAAIAARAGQTVSLGLVDELERLVGQLRRDLETSDRLLAMTSPGDAALGALLGAGAEFEALLESLQTSLEMMDLVAGRSLPRALRIIAHSRAASAVA